TWMNRRRWLGRFSSADQRSLGHLSTQVIDCQDVHKPSKASVLHGYRSAGVWLKNYRSQSRHGNSGNDPETARGSRWKCAVRKAHNYPHRTASLSKPCAIGKDLKIRIWVLFVANSTPVIQHPSTDKDK